MLSIRTSIPALAVCLAVAGTSQANVKIGVFDPNRIIAESKLGQDLQDELNQFRVQKQAEITKARDEVKRLIDQYQAGVDTMSMERREEIEADLTKRRRDLERMARDLEIDLEKKRRQAVREIEAAVARVIDGYGRRNGYTIILQRDLCAFAVDTIDIRAEVVRLVNAESTGQ